MSKLITGLSAVLLMAVFIARAQKLPSTQAEPMRAPAGIKIDGKSDEWGDKYQAYNKNIEAFYTVANDDDNLYLIIKAPMHEIADKIIRGGITLIVNHGIKKNDPDAISITYPVLRGADMSVVSNMFSRSTYSHQDSMWVSPRQMNNIVESKAKTIEIAGVKAINDKEISVYNDNGIKAVGLFDDKNAYVYELCLPLKYVNIPAGESFSYHIKVNEMPETFVRPAGGSMPPPPPPMPMGGLGTTDFWGVYKLAKK